MSNFLTGMSTEGMERQGDYLGGSYIFDADVYAAQITMMYGIQSDKGAKGVVIHADLEFRDDAGALVDNKEYRETIYFTKATGENFYIDKKTGKKNLMPGFAMIDDICVLAHPQNKGFLEQAVEERHVPQYDKDAKKEIPRPAPVFVDMIDGKLDLAILRTKENKQVLSGTTYVDDPTGATVEKNNIDKAFHAQTKQTVTEAREGKEATFRAEWIKRNKGQLRDKSQAPAGKPGAPGAKPGAAASGGQTAAGLFNKPGA